MQDVPFNFIQQKSSTSISGEMNEVKAPGGDIRFYKEFYRASSGIIWAQMRRGAFDWKGGASLVDNNQNEKMFEQLKQMLHEMKFGSITLVVQDGKVIQLEKVEKVRIK